jgi:outer membrane protein assembly complex protein YaeT
MPRQLKFVRRNCRASNHHRRTYEEREQNLLIRQREGSVIDSRNGCIDRAGRLLIGSLMILVYLSGWRSPARAATLAALDPTVHYNLARVAIDGERAFSENDLLAGMATKSRAAYLLWKPLPEFDPDQFTNDLGQLARFYQAHGYYGAKLSYDLTIRGSEVSVLIQVREGQPVRVTAINVKVSGTPRPKQLERSFVLPLKVNEIFDQGSYENSEEALQDLYMNHSYAHAKVSRRAVVEAGTRQAQVWYAVKAGVPSVFGDTKVLGTREVEPSLVLRELVYKKGESFDARKIAASRQNILALNLFSEIEFNSGKNPVDRAVVPIEIQVRERPPRNLSLSVGYNTQTQFNARLAWSHYNFLGGGRQLTLSGNYSNVTSALDAKLLQPRFPSTQSNLVLEIKQERQTYQTYQLNASRFIPRLTYKFSSALTAFVGWRLEYLKFNQVNASTIAAIGGMRRNGILSGPEVGVVYNSTEDPFDPQQGHVFSLLGNLSDGVFGGDYRYWRTTAEACNYTPLGWRMVLATRLEAGLANTFGSVRDIPLSERFYSGGEGSVRGYGLRRIGPLSLSNDPLGGLSLVEGSIELRRPLYSKLSGAAFFDCGQVSVHPYDLRVDALQCGFGPALSMTTPVGPVRLDLGFPIQKPHGDSSWQLYFSIGQFF